MKRILLLLLVLGCSSRPNVAPGTLSITPNPATFRPIEKGEEQVSQNLFLRNRGREPITIQRVGLTELDDVQELCLRVAYDVVPDAHISDPSDESSRSVSCTSLSVITFAQPCQHIADSCAF